MAVTIPDLHYIGIKGVGTYNDGSMPLGFLTPGGTNAAAKKRISTVDSWVGANGGRHEHIAPDESEQFVKDNPSAKFLRDHSDYERNPHIAYLIPNEEGKHYKILDNVPNEPQLGFRITKMVSRSGSWNGGNKLVRIEDPRGFELEISVDNLVKIMSMTTFIDGVCQTECLWGREGSSNILLPVNSEPYEAARATTDYRNKEVISLRDVKFGDTVELKKTEQFEGLTGEYLGAYNVYNLLSLQEVQSESGSYWGKKPTHEMIKVLKRYIIRTKLKEGKYRYIGVASAKVHRIIKSVDTPIERTDIDPEDFQDSSYSNVSGMPIAISLKKVKPEVVAATAQFIPVDLEYVETVAKTRDYGDLALWADEPKSSSKMRMHKTYRSSYDNKVTKEEHDKIFVGEVTSIDAANNKWKVVKKLGVEGKGPWTLLTDPTGKAGLLVCEHDWYRLAFTVNGETFNVPVSKEHVYW